MRINEFFRTRLNAPLRNPRQSWGATDPKTGRVFLRDGREQLEVYEGWALVFREKWKDRYGGKERLEHLQQIRNGAEGFFVTIERYDNNGKIIDFDADRILQLGDVESEGDVTYAKIIEEISVEDFSTPELATGREAEDVGDICSEDVPPTKRRVLIEARIGQGKFRDDVLSKWEQQCAVTGVSVKAAIRASHIKPWRVCEDSDRLNPYNGLPLVATLDALFDVGLITFSPSGQIRVSSLLSAADIQDLELRHRCLRKKPHKRTSQFLRFHAEEVFRP